MHRVAWTFLAGWMSLCTGLKANQIHVTVIGVVLFEVAAKSFPSACDLQAAQHIALLGLERATCAQQSSGNWLSKSMAYAGRDHTGDRGCRPY